MDIKKLQGIVVDALEDIKAQDIHVYDTVHLTSLFDRIAIASGTSNRQTKALAASVRDKVKESGGAILSVEGEDTGEWVLVDLGDMIVHIMQPAIRAYYRLEEIWGDKEVKLGAAKRISKRSASEALDGAAAPKKAARHLTVTHTQAASAEAPKKRTPKKTASPNGETVTAARKATPKAAAAKKVASKPTAARKPAAGKAKAGAAKTTAAPQKPAVKKAPAKRAPAK